MKRVIDYLASYKEGVANALPKRARKYIVKPPALPPKPPLSPGKRNPEMWYQMKQEYMEKVRAYMDYVRNYDYGLVPLQYQKVALEEANRGMGPVLYKSWNELPDDAKEVGIDAWFDNLIGSTQRTEQRANEYVERARATEEQANAYARREQAFAKAADDERVFREFEKNLREQRAKQHTEWGQQPGIGMDFKLPKRGPNTYKYRPTKSSSSSSEKKRRNTQKRSSSSERKRRNAQKRSSSSERKRREASAERERQERERQERERQERERREASAERERQERERQERERQRQEQQQQQQRPLNAYEVLGITVNDIVNKDPSDRCKSIKTAYRKTAKLKHPDKGGTTEDMQRVASAYDELKIIHNCE